ncbi:MAG TPA: PHP domain-containing protein [Oscillospiraceae bacterium]|nr:PHP domain-containing protein [Oscillospiraceae bacterium]
MIKEYENYHKHDSISNIFTPDTHIKTIDYINRIKELGYGCYYTTNHGSGGDVFESLTLCRQNNIRCLYGIEGYIVKNPLEKDKRNYHIVIIPVDNVARKKVNLIVSKANIEGFYYKPRFFIEDLLKLNPNEVYITTACVAGILKDEDSIKNIFIPLIQHFGKNLFLEVQNHCEETQITTNKKCLLLSKKFNLKLIAANDSHYIYPEQAKDRLNFLKGKGIDYGNEDNYLLDFPDYDTMFNRFKNQGVLTDEQIIEAMANTLIFRNCADIDIDKNIKMPSIYPNFTPDEKINELKKHIAKKFKVIAKQENIIGDELNMYKRGIVDEMKVIEDTKEINTADYFLLNEKLVDLAVNKYNGVLTKTGRGSCGGFYINKILGMTQLDRFKLDIKLYPERFMSTARLLENHALPDIDYNVVSQEPFVKAAKELLGEYGCYPMIAYGTMQIGEAFRNVCRTHGLEYDEYNEIAKEIENYIDDNKWKPFIDEANKYVDTVVSASIHPCAYLLDNKNLQEEYGVVRIGDNICAMITSGEADEYKMLKDDFLLVTVYKLIDETFKLIGKPIITVKELFESLNDNIWDIFEKGLTCTLNQVDGDWATSLLKKFKPKTISDMAMFVACLRPFFEPWRDGFIKRDKFSTGSSYLDKILTSTKSYIIFQENLMQYFEWLGVTPAESIGLIKKISKKKIHPEDFRALENRIKIKWIENTGSIDNFDETWNMIQSCMAYGFCVSGNTKLLRNRNGNGYVPTIEEMYNIKNNRQYALKNGHLSLYKKYRSYGYGKGLSLCDDGMLHENDIEDIHFTGIRKTYRVITESGATIDCTDNHKFPTPNGTFELKGLKFGDCLYVNKQYERGLMVDIEKIVSIEYIGEENVYSVKMAAPNHTFVVDSGIVTSNCSAHAVATAVDSLYGAYLKANYPLEYYTVALSNYADDTDRTHKLVNELSYFNIKLLPIKFGKSSSEYTMDKETNSIYKGIESIKYCNSKIAEELLELSKQKDYKTFIELLDDITAKTSINSRQLEILIGLNFFSDFGNNKYLLNIYNLYNGIKEKGKTILPSFRNCSVISKKNIDNYSTYGLSEYLVKKYSNKETQSQYREIDNIGLLSELCNKIENKSMNVVEQMKFEKEYLQYIEYINPKVSDDYYIVIDFKTYKNSTQPYLIVRNISSGEELKTRIKRSNIYKSKPFGEFSILKIYGFIWDFKRKKVGDDWIITDEKEPILEEYEVIKNEE